MQRRSRSSSFQRTLGIPETAHGREHQTVAQDLINQAEPAYLRALAIPEPSNPRGYSNVPVAFRDLAMRAQAEGRYEEAEDIYRWTLEVSARALGPEDSTTAFLRQQYAQYLQAVGRDDEAARLIGG